MTSWVTRVTWVPKVTRVTWVTRMTYVTWVTSGVTWVTGYIDSLV